MNTFIHHFASTSEFFFGSFVQLSIRFPATSPLGIPLAKALSWLRPTLVAHARPWSCPGQRWGSSELTVDFRRWKFRAKLQTWDRINDYWLVAIKSYKNTMFRWSNIHPYWTCINLVGGLEHFFFHTLGMSSSQLTFILFRGVAQPPTRLYWTHEKTKKLQIFPDFPTSRLTRLIPLRNPIILRVPQVSSEFPTSPWPSPQVIKHDPTPRSQFHHVIDVAPTVYEAIGIKFPQHVEGVQQMPLDGVSMVWLGESWNMMKHVDI